MTIARVNASGWGVGTKLTSAQANALDLNTTYALDKRAGQLDTLASVITTTGAGRIIGRYAVGDDIDTSYYVTGSGFIDVTTLTADRIYTLQNTNAVVGDVIDIAVHAGSYGVTVKNAGGTTLAVLGLDSLTSRSDSTWGTFLFNGTDWVLWRNNRLAKATPMEYSSSNTWIAPEGVYRVLVLGCGGGGGGGGAYQPGTTQNQWAGGGGGGGGALLNFAMVQVFPGNGYDITVGSGGTGGAPGFSGADGGDTTFAQTGGGTVLACFVGAQGGGKGGMSTALTTYVYAVGGGPVRAMLRNENIAVPSTGTGSDPFFVQPPASGGNGKVRASPGTWSTGSKNPYGTYSGGASGVSGTDAGAYGAGGPGGGGGAGPYGDGATSGSGANGNSAGAGFGGGTGLTALANTGAGGGGGGAAGAGSTAAGLSKAGGNGGSGRLLVIPLR